MGETRQLRPGQHVQAWNGAPRNILVRNFIGKRDKKWKYRQGKPMRRSTPEVKCGYNINKSISITNLCDELNSAKTSCSKRKITRHWKYREHPRREVFTEALGCFRYVRYLHQTNMNVRVLTIFSIINRAKFHLFRTRVAEFDLQVALPGICSF